jgi:hemerythrin superfamily protein
MATRAKSAPTAEAAKKDATALLQRDHREVQRLFKQFEKLSDDEGTADDRQALAEQICVLLSVHAQIEEELFYPAARAAEVKADLLDEAEVEHASAKELIAQIRAMEPDEPLYDAKVIVLGEYVNHHVEEEEEQMFPKCRKSDMDLVVLAEEMSERKAELMADESELAA